MGIGVNNRRFHHIALIWHITASVCGALLFDTPAMAQAAEGAKARDKVAPGQKKHAIKTKHAAGISAKTTPLAGKPVAVAEPAAAAPVSPARFDKTFGVKGWDIYFPSFGDTLTQDYGGWRSALAQTGFGFLEFNVSTFNLNMLSTPTKVPASSFVPSLGISSAYPYCSKTSGSICAGSQTYFGQRPAFFNGSFAYLTYDTSRWGVPDGQILLTGSLVGTTDEAYYPHVFQMSGLSWYQTLFDKKVELKFGYIANLQDFVGTFIGGNFANTFGVGASIPVELGLPDSPTTAPTARATIHLTGNVYDEFAIQRSLPAKGPTGNALVDETKLNPTGFTFSRAGEGLLYINELGYKNEAAPGVPQTWGRFGIMYNTSQFSDLSRLFTANATKTGNSAYYLLADRQLWQQAPGSPFTAYRGIYAGVSAMYAPPEETAFSQYYEGRLYWVGPFDSRPTDMATFVYAHNVISHYIPDQLNAVTAPLAAQGFALPLAYHSTNGYTISYLAHVTPGLYVSLGVQYTDHPSIEYFKGQGSSLNFLAGVTSVF